MPVAKTDVTQEPRPAVPDLVEITVAANQIVYGRDKDGNPGVRAEGEGINGRKDAMTVFVTKRDLENQPHIGTAKHGSGSGDALPKMANTDATKPAEAASQAPPVIPALAPQPIPAPMPKPAEAKA